MGDCWFLSAVAVLAEVSRISEVIITPEYNDEGIYTVRFCIQVTFFFVFFFFSVVNVYNHNARTFSSATHFHFLVFIFRTSLLTL